MINCIIEDIISGYLDEYTITKTDRYWGFILHIETKGREGKCKVYQYRDNRQNLYICNLEVCIENRRKGIANKLLDFCESISRDLGANRTFLWVDKESWMREWYKRKGYSDFVSHAKYKGCIWMRK